MWGLVQFKDNFVISAKEQILTSKYRAKHSFAGQQPIYFLQLAKHNFIYIFTVLFYSWSNRLLLGYANKPANCLSQAWRIHIYKIVLCQDSTQDKLYIDGSRAVVM